MNPNKMGLRLGEKILARVEEVQMQNELLMSFHGHLFRVANTSNKKFQSGDWVDLVLIGENPMRFILYSSYRAQLDRLA